MSLIGANTLITEGKVIPDNSLMTGSPGKVARTLTEGEIAALRANAAHYVELMALYRTGFSPVHRSDRNVFPLRNAPIPAWKKSYAIISNPQYPCIWSCRWMFYWG
ncbi:MAG: gamma carbonic anhydrase family protein [Pseudomonadota bacterium]